VQLVALFWRFFFRVTLCEEMASLSLGVLASRFRAIGALVHVHHCWGYGAH
jgi:ABC-type sulfate transport system permease subunit